VPGTGGKGMMDSGWLGRVGTGGGGGGGLGGGGLGGGFFFFFWGGGPIAHADEGRGERARTRCERGR